MKNNLRFNSFLNVQGCAKRKLFGLTLAVAIILSFSSAPAAVLTLTDLNTNSWVGNPSTNINGPYNGYQYAVGNLGNAPQNFQTLLKFDISTLSGSAVSGASLNLSLYFTYYDVTKGPTNTVAVSAFNTDLGAAAFASASFGGATISLGSFDVVSRPNEQGDIYSVNITSALQSAIDSGFSYFAVQINNVTADALPGPLYGSEVVSFSSTTLPTIEFTAVPEPSIIAMFVLAGIGVLCSTRVRAAHQLKA